MHISKSSYSFLSELGLMRPVSGVNQSSLETLQKQYLVSQSTNDLFEAYRIAEEATLRFGLEGLKLYFPIRIALLKEIAKSDDIDVDLSKTLSIIFFLEENAILESWIDNYKNQLLKECNPHRKEEIIEQANSMASFYPTLST